MLHSSPHRSPSWHHLPSAPVLFPTPSTPRFLDDLTSGFSCDQWPNCGLLPSMALTGCTAYVSSYHCCPPASHPGHSSQPSFWLSVRSRIFFVLRSLFFLF